MEYHILHQSGSFYLENEENEKYATIEYYINSSNQIVITHTFVDSAYRGQDIANLLIDALIKFAESNKQLIVPICSFAVKVLSQTKYKHLVAH